MKHIEEIVLFPGISAEMLLDEAREARKNSYSPYSGFPVGAAVLSDDGKIFRGCNIENGSYGLTICAERNSISAMVSSGRRKPLAVAIVGKTGEPCLPCGACRQFMAEFNPFMKVILENGRGSSEVIALEELLPRPFLLGDTGI